MRNKVVNKENQYLRQIKYPIFFMIFSGLSTLVHSELSQSELINDQSKLLISQAAYPNTLSQKPVEKLRQASNIQVLRYLMPNVKGNHTEATAMVIFPKKQRPESGWPVVVWTHGTVGGGDACAPTNNPINDNFSVLGNSLLELGYVIVAPDYEGLGTKGRHPYLNLKSEANSAIYAVKAAQQKYKSLLSPNWMSVGQSQGGHASFGIAEFAGDDPSFKGAVATAPASTLGKIITEIAPKRLAEVEKAEQAGKVKKGTASAVYGQVLTFGALIGDGIKAYEPTFSMDRFFEKQSVGIANKAGGSNGEDGLCFDAISEEFTQDINQFLADNPTKKIMDYPGLRKDFLNDPVISNFLKENQPASKAFKKPVYVVQGKEDELVPYQVTIDLVKNVNQLGTQPPVILDIVEGASHKQAIIEKNAKVVNFIKSHLPPR